MALPARVVEIAFATDATSDPGIVGADWKDVSTYVRSASMRRGRQRDLDRIEAGTCHLTLDNRDRRFDPTHTGSPYSPNVVPMRHVRVMAGYLGLVLADKPKFYWRLGESAGAASAVDETANQNGTYQGSPTLGVAGRIAGNTAVDLNGTTHYISVADDPDLDVPATFTLECWINPDALAAAGLIVRNNAGDVDPGEYNLRLKADGQIEFLSDTGATVTTTSSGITTGGGWYHIVVTFDNAAGTKCRIYVNGVERGAGNPDLPGANAETLLIGRRGTGGFFDGQVDEVAIYHTALSATRILDHYNEGAKGIADGHLFRGLVDGWPQKWPANKDAIVEVQCTDAFKVFANLEPPTNQLELEIGLLTPKAWWRLADPIGTATPIDSGPSHFTATVDKQLASGDFGAAKADFGAEPVLPYGGPTSMHTGMLTEENGPFVNLPMAAVLTGNNYTIEMVVKKAGDPTTGAPDLYRQFGGSSAQDLIRISLTAAGYPRFSVIINTVSFPIDTTASGVKLTDGVSHHLACRREFSGGVGTIKIYIDGIERATLAANDSGAMTNPTAGRIGASIAGDCTMGDVVFWDTALSAAEIADHASWAVTPFADATPASVITRMLDYLSWPSALRDIDTGRSTLQALALSGKALELFQRIAETEAGQFFIAPDGKVTFHDRHVNLLSPGNTSQATFSDDQTADPGSLPYQDLVPEFDDARLYNQARMGREGGTPITVDDAASQTKYLKRTFERTDLLTNSDLEVVDHGNWIVSRHKDPKLEITSIVLTPQRSDAIWTQVLKREIGDLVTVKRRPPGGSAPINQEVRIEGSDHEITPDFWKTTWWLSGFDSVRYWILGDSTYGVLGSTTRLAF